MAKAKAEVKAAEVKAVPELTIWKFALHTKSEKQAIAMPEGARILCAKRGWQGVFLYAVVDPTAKPVNRNFFSFATGSKVDPQTFTGEASYHGTFETATHTYHVFEDHSTEQHS